MTFGLMNLVLSIPILVFLAEPESKFTQPAIIGSTLTNPNCARMIDVGLLIRSIRKRTSCYMMGGIQQLSGF